MRACLHKNLVDDVSGRVGFSEGEPFDSLYTTLVCADCDCTFDDMAAVADDLRHQLDAAAALLRERAVSSQVFVNLLDAAASAVAQIDPRREVSVPAAVVDALVRFVSEHHAEREVVEFIRNEFVGVEQV